MIVLIRPVFAFLGIKDWRVLRLSALAVWTVILLFALLMAPAMPQTYAIVYPRMLDRLAGLHSVLASLMCQE